MNKKLMMFTFALVLTLYGTFSFLPQENIVLASKYNKESHLVEPNLSDAERTAINKEIDEINKKINLFSSVLKSSQEKVVFYKNFVDYFQQKVSTNLKSANQFKNDMKNFKGDKRSTRYKNLEKNYSFYMSEYKKWNNNLILLQQNIDKNTEYAKACQIKINELQVRLVELKSKTETIIINPEAYFILIQIEVYEGEVANIVQNTQIIKDVLNHYEKTYHSLSQTAKQTPYGIRLLNDINRAKNDITNYESQKNKNLKTISELEAKYESLMSIK